MAGGAYVMEWENGLDYAEHLGGESWYAVGSSWPRLRKRLHRHHWAQTRGMINGHYVERCPCGAYGPGPWFKRL